MNSHHKDLQIKKQRDYYRCFKCSRRDKNKSRMASHIATCEKDPTIEEEVRFEYNRNKTTKTAPLRVREDLSVSRDFTLQSEGARISNFINYTGYIRRQQFQREINLMREEILRLKSPKKLTTLGPTYQFIHDAVSDISESIISTVTAQIFKTLRGASLDYVQRREHIIKSNLISFFQSANYDTIAYNWAQAVEEVQNYYNNVVAVRESHGKSQIARYKSGFKTLSQLSFDQIHHKISMYQILSERSADARRCFKDAYSFMQKNCTSFDLPPISINLSNNHKSHMKKITLAEVKNLLNDLVSQRKFITATDLWAATTMGLRKSQLLQVYFQEESKFFTAVKILERKNQNETIRIIPRSLATMIALSKASYPMSFERFCQLRQLCIQRLGRFYGLRHVCITSIVQGLFESYNLARFHKAPSTTQKHYIDMSSAELIHSAFVLQSEGKVEENVEFSNQILKITGAKVQVEPFVKEEVSPFTFEKFLLQDQDEILIGVDDNESSRIYKQTNRQSTKKCPNMQYFLQEECSVGQQIIQKVYQQGQLSSQRYLTNLESSLQQKIELVESINQMKMNCNSLILGTKTIYGTEIPPIMIPQNDIFQSPATTNYEVNNHLRKISKCSCCQPSCQLRLVSCSNCSSLKSQCKKTRSTNHRCNLSEETHKKKLSIICKGKFIASQFKLPTFLEEWQDSHLQRFFTRNVPDKQRFLLQLVEVSQYDDLEYVSNDVPQSFICKFAQITQQIKDMVKIVQAQELMLPLQIKWINQSKGFGVLASKMINPNEIICSYRGQIRTNDTIDMRDDSLWQLGWINQKNILIAPLKKKNIGRYINSSNSPKEVNSIMNICVSSYRFFLILVASKAIQQGEEVLYSYGPNYWKN